MKKAVIDIGSNTINLLVATFSDNRFTVLEDRKIHAKLARGGINKGTIAPEAFQRGMAALKEHKATCDGHGLTDADIVTYATASVRAASNGEVFASEVLRHFGLIVQTIDGDTEAHLIHSGIKNGYPLSDKKVVVMDIGGGSVEFIITNRETVFWKQSFNVGVTKLLDRFSPSDPPKAKELESVKSFVEFGLDDLWEALRLYQPEQLVGSSGSFDTIRAIIEADGFSSLEKHKDPETKTWFKIDKKIIAGMAESLSAKTTEERKQVPGMDEMRAEYFPLAFVLINLVLEHLPGAGIYQCSYALKEGAFFHHFVRK